MTALTLSASQARAERAVWPLNNGWSFALGDHAGAEALAWNDAGWRKFALGTGKPVAGKFAIHCTLDGGEAGSCPVVGEQAKDAKFEGGEWEQGNSGYNGIGYVNFTNRPGWVEWYQENDGAPARTKLTIRCSAKPGACFELSLNEEIPVPLVSDAAGDKSPGWHNASTAQVLQSGANRIRLTAIGGVKIDELILVPLTESK